MASQFLWLNESVEMPAIDFPLIEKWIIAVAQSHNRMVGQLNYLFCDDSKILEVNREFLNHDYYTDIITFDDCLGRLLRGDIVISLDTVRSNAQGMGATYDNELLRVIIHGVLHLCGINDKGPGEREVMEKHENDALKLFGELRLND